MPADPRIEQYQSASVRDLAWAILSPTLMQSPDAGHNCAERWFNDAFTAIEPHLQQLDRDDSPLVHHLHEPTNHRLGLYFERLWSYWLQHNIRYRLNSTASSMTPPRMKSSTGNWRSSSTWVFRLWHPPTTGLAPT